MIRTQVQLPDALYRDAKRVASEQEITLAEVVRRGLEHMVQIYPRREAASDTWRPPPPHRLGPFRVSDDAWRELANQG